MAANPIREPFQTEQDEIVALTLKACELAKSAISHAAEGLTRRAAGPFTAVNECERELDRLDRDIDERITLAVTHADSPDAVRELLACMKFMVELERIGDLVSRFGGYAQAIGSRVDMEDIKDLIQMATVLEQMLVDVHAAFSRRDLERVISIFRADAIIDRLRNLMYIRHVDNHDGMAGPEGVQVLFMAQSLERAGDHVKNLAEEVCHFATGHTVRHLLHSRNKSEEQMFIDWLRDRQSKEGV